MKKDKFILNNNKCKCSYIARKPSYTSEFIACTSAAFFIVALLLIIPTNMKRMKTSESNSENALLSECSGDGADVLSSKWYMEGVVQSISPSDSSINQCRLRSEVPFSKGESFGHPEAHRCVSVLLLIKRSLIRTEPSTPCFIENSELLSLPTKFYIWACFLLFFIKTENAIVYH